MKLKVDFLTRGLLTLVLAVAISSFAFAQRTITGTVTDAENGEPLISATVVVVGSSTGTITDFDGKYSLEVPDDATQLEFSYTGYATAVADINASNVVDIALSAGAVLDEIVVTGYGTQKSKEVTSAITSVKAEDFNQGNVQSPTQLLQGKVAGLNIARAGGNPNNGFQIRLRGVGTAGANASPLIVIDGVPGGELQSVDPNDIASVDVLKDGSAAAIYGTRGAAGVILITTKKGQAGRTDVNYNGFVTAENRSRTVDVLDAAGYRAFGGGNDLGSSTNWFDELTTTGLSHVHNLSLSGGSKSTTYRVSANYRDVEGVALNTGFQRINARMNVTQKALNDKLTVTANVATTTEDKQLGFDYAFRQATIYNPTSPVRDASNTQYDGYAQQILFDYYNPVAIMEQNINNENVRTLTYNLRGSYELTDGLNFSLFYSEQKESKSQSRYYDKQSLWVGADRNGLAAQVDEEFSDQLFNATLTYDYNIDANKSLKLLAGYEYQEFNNEGFGVQGGNFLTDAFTFNNLSAAQDFANGLGSVSSYRDQNKLIAFFGRANLNIDDTYYIQASLRREGSSKFGRDERWGFFPGLSAGVVLTKLADIPAFDNLKLRAGYGQTGNPPTQSYLSQQRFGPRGNFFFNGAFTSSFAPVSNPNPLLKWERKIDYNFGLDFSMMDYRLNGSIEYYNNTTKDLLLNFPVPVPPNLFGSTFINIGEIKSTGIELSLDYAVVNNKDFTWNTQVTWTSFLENKLVTLSDSDLGFDFGGSRDISNLGAPGQNDTPLIRIEEGADVGQIWGLVYEGVDDAGKWIFADTNGDGKRGESDDRTVIGNGLPKGLLGWNNSFTFGQVDFNFFLRGTFGHDLVNTFRAFYEAPNQISSYNILASSDPNLTDSPKFSSFHVEDASFLRLDNASIGYTLNLPDNSAFKSARFYVTVNNLFTITSYKGVDPEARLSDSDQDGDGLDQGEFGPLSPGIDRRDTYFATRAFSFGVNIGF
jgi:iron complex outermembrane receptor protein